VRQVVLQEGALGRTAMRSGSATFRLGFAALGIACSSVASAQVEAGFDPRPMLAPVALVLDGALGVGDGSSGKSRAAAELVARIRFPRFEVGAVIGHTGTIFERDDAYYGALLGVRHRLTDELGLELLGEGGVHQATAFAGLFSTGQGEATLPYVGARVGLDSRFGGRVRFVCGLWGVIRADLGSGHVTGEITSGFLESHRELHDFGELGGSSLLLELRVGIELGLGGE
jgi:hypothetical protein